MDRETKRRLVVQELLQTETNYVIDLQLIVQLFLSPMREQKVSAADLGVVFSNLELLLQFHEQFLEALKIQETLAPEDQTLAGTFLKYADFFKLYRIYMNNMNNSITALKRLKATSKVTKILNDAFKNPLSRMLYIDDFMIKPVQRIMKYPLLLKEIQKTTLEEHTDYKNLPSAIAKVEGILENINQENKENDALKANVQKLKEINAQLEDSKKVKLLDNVFRKFIQRRTITRIRGDQEVEYTYFLFSDMMLVCERPDKYRVKHVYPFNKCLIRPAVDTPSLLEAFEILRMDHNDKIHTYGIADAEDRGDLIKFLQEFIFAQTIHVDKVLKLKYKWFLEKPDDEPVTDLVLCYRLFCSPSEFLNILESKYPTIDAGRAVLSQFLEGLEPSDFETDGAETATNAFLEKVTNILTKIDDAEVRAEFFGKLIKVQKLQTVSSIDALSDKIREIDLSEEKLCIDIAKTVTLAEAKLVRRVKPQELLATEGPTLSELKRKFEWMRRWICTKILSNDTPKKRADAICVFITLGKEFQRLRNFNGVAEVVTSLRSLPIQRLVDTWAFVPPQAMNDYQTLRNIVGHQEVKAALDSARGEEPCVPFITDFLAELGSINMEQYIDGKINMEFVKTVSVILREFKSYQTKRYEITSNRTIYDQYAMKDEEIEAKAEKLEERVSSRRCSTTLVNLKSFEKNQYPKEGFIPELASSKLNDRDWEMLMSISEKITYNQNDIILRDNAKTGLYLILGGSVTQSRKGKVLATLTDGDAFGEQALLYDDAVAEFTATAESTTVTVQLARIPYVRQLLESDPDLAARFYKFAANNINKGFRQVMTAFASVSKPLPSLKSSTALKPSENKLLEGQFTLAENEEVLTTQDCKYGRVSGQLFITNCCIYFYGKMFGLQRKKQLRIDQVADVIITGGSVLEVKQTEKVKKFTLKTAEAAQEAQNTIMAACASPMALPALLRRNTLTRIINNGSQVEVHENDGMEQAMTDSDWQLILQGAKIVTYKASTTIITEGIRPTQLCQIISGVCSIRKNIANTTTTTTAPSTPTPNSPQPQHQQLLSHSSSLTPPGSPIPLGSSSSAVSSPTTPRLATSASGSTGSNFVVIATRVAGDIFGEMSFLDPAAVASANVVAITDVEVCVLDFQYVSVLLSVHTHITPRFFKYLSLLIHRRMAQFEQQNN